MIKCVIFDFDDTLVKSLHDKNEFYDEYKKLLKKQKLPYSMSAIKRAHNFAEQEYIKFGGTQRQPTDFYFEKQFFNSLGITKNQKLAKLLHNAYIAYRLKLTKLMPNTKETLSALKKAGISLNVITNTREDTNRILAKKHGIYKYFDHFLMSHEEGTIKSDLKIFHLLLEKLNKNKKTKILPSECLMVGNNLNEDTAASQIGMKTAILTTKMAVNKNLQSFEPNYYIDNLKEIIAIVKNESKITCPDIKTAEQIVMQRINNLLKMHKAVIVGVTGGAGAGKTVFSKRLCQLLNGSHLEADYYFKEYKKPKKLTLDDPRAFDFNLLTKHLKKLKKGQTINCPDYDFDNYKRIGTKPIKPAKVIVVEGLFTLHKKVLGLLDLSIFIESPPNTRLARAIKRDTTERGQTAKSTKIGFIKDQKPSYKKHIAPTKENAEIIIYNNQKRLKNKGMLK